MRKFSLALLVTLAVASSAPVNSAHASQPYRVAQADYIYACSSGPGQFLLARAANTGGLSQCQVIGFSLAEAFGRVCFYLQSGTSGPGNWQQYANFSNPAFMISIPAC